MFQLFCSWRSIRKRLPLFFVLAISLAALITCKATDGPKGDQSGRKGKDRADIEAEELARIDKALGHSQYGLHADDLNRLNGEVHLTGATQVKMNKLENK